MNHTLTLGLLMVMLVSWWFPQLGRELQEAGMSPLCIVGIFFLTGLGLKKSEDNFSLSLLKSSFWMITISMVLCPWLVSQMCQMIELEPALSLGLIVMASMPTTLSSGMVIAVSAGGSAFWALGYVLITNTVSIFSIPFVLPQLLELKGELNQLELLSKLVLLVLLPCLLGLLSQSIKGFQTLGRNLKACPTWLVLCIVMMSMSSSLEVFEKIRLIDGFTMMAMSLTIHLGLMAFMYLVSACQKLDQPERLSLLILGSQKTLPIALSVLALMEGSVGLAVVACLTFHFLQLSLDAFLVKWLK